MPEKREFSDRIRSRIHVRDASLTIIATEGTQTEKHYFEELSSTSWYHNSKVRVAVLDYIQADSDPEDVLEMLDGFRRQFLLHTGDQLWLVIDVDHRKDRTNRTRLERELVAILGRYNKKHPDPNDFLPHLRAAIEQAQALDIHPDDRWPNDLGSRVYRLAVAIING